MTRRRPGRKRAPGPRSASGRLIKPRDLTDTGSELLQAQRAALVRRDDGTTGDPTMASHPLGALLASGAITQEQHDAGLAYARLYGAVAGRTSAKAAVLDDDRAGRAPDDDAAREERRKRDEALWREAAAVLAAVGSKAKTGVDNIAAHQRWPRFMLSDTVRQSDARIAMAIGAGLEALAGLFGMRKTRRAA